MAGQQELQVQQKQEVEKRQESTTPTRAFLPTTDIFETDEALTVFLEMPGVDRENIEISAENGVLTTSDPSEEPFESQAESIRRKSRPKCRAV